MENITEQLEGLLRKNNVEFMTLTDLKKELSGSALWLQLGFKKKTVPASEFKKGLALHLGEKLTFKAKGRSFCLALNQTDEEFIVHAIQKNPGKTPAELLKKLFFTKDKYIVYLNALIQQCRICTKLNDQYKCIAFSCESTPPLISPPPENFTVEKFQAAYRELEQGRFYVRVYELRRHLSWPRDKFDTMVKTLRNARIIQLQAGDTENLSGKDVEDSFKDENGFLMLTLMWRIS